MLIFNILSKFNTFFRKNLHEKTALGRLFSDLILNFKNFTENVFEQTPFGK